MSDLNERIRAAQREAGETEVTRWLEEKGLSPQTGLTPAQAERLQILVEECAEVIQVAMKIQRFGVLNRDPEQQRSTQNLHLLEREMGDVRAAMIMLCECGLASKDTIHRHAAAKLETVKKWLRHG